MSFEPQQDIVQRADPHRSGDLADLRRRVTVLEQGRPTIQTVSGSPTTFPREGTPVADISGSRFGLYLPSLGGWRFTTLT